ncbi:hypothetical protein [Hydrogenivirga caldilitoris]|uniref:hypothetical protein n=1 Tax=Hydrogenivirga caldilitoris TaxID=246264 RepID=UPI0011C4AA0E|nr:hypothetical protein [Hydrogenivirga caldilitoris]
MEFSQYLIKVLISLLIVLGAAVLLLPFILRKFIGVKGFGGKGNFEIKKIAPITKSVFIVELEVKGNTVVLCVSERGADVIYREYGNNLPSSNLSEPGSVSPESDNPPH